MARRVFTSGNVTVELSADIERFVDGLREGPARGFYPDGTPESAGAYRRGLRDGARR